MFRKGPDRQRVTRGPETRDHANTHRGDHRDMAEAFTRMGVGQVQFDHRQGNRTDRITQGDRAVRIGTRVQDDPVLGAARGMDRVDQRAFVVGLRKGDAGADRIAGRDAWRSLDIGQRRMAVDPRARVPRRFRLGPFNTRIFITQLPIFETSL